MLQDLAKVGTDVMGTFHFGGFSWDWQQWVMMAFFIWMAGSFGVAVYENKYPAARPSHIVFLIVQAVAFTVLWTSGFFK